MCAPASHAACVGTQSGDLAALEELAFRDPASALPQLAAAISSPAGHAAHTSRRAACHRRRRLAPARLQPARHHECRRRPRAAAAGDLSDLAIRMRTVRALESTNVGGIDAATVELTRLIEAVHDRPLALGCLLRDRGWLNFRDGNPDQALDDLLRAYALLRQHAQPRRSHGGGGTTVDGAILACATIPQALALAGRDHRVLPRTEGADPARDGARSARRDSQGRGSAR